jgi:hypothetical protein
LGRNRKNQAWYQILISHVPNFLEYGILFLLQDDLDSKYPQDYIVISVNISVRWYFVSIQLWEYLVKIQFKKPLSLSSSKYWEMEIETLTPSKKNSSMLGSREGVKI